MTKYYTTSIDDTRYETETDARIAARAGRVHERVYEHDDTPGYHTPWCTVGFYDRFGRFKLVGIDALYIPEIEA